uniref:C-type lectin domain-containing protein n=1 Tax=Neogobius melanostomus TaxID=47308 RepID=A0A8C6S692_9GOBI
MPKQVNTFLDGFRQGTKPTNPLNHKDAALSFKALPAEPSNHLLEGFRAGAGPFMPVRDGDRQPLNHIEAVKTFKSRQGPNKARCDGEIINGRCYVFNPMPMPFLEAQDSCKSHNPSAELASVTNEDLQSRLVSMVTNGGQRDPVVTWLGGTVRQVLKHLAFYTFEIKIYFT